MGRPSLYPLPARCQYHDYAWERVSLALLLSASLGLAITSVAGGVEANRGRGIGHRGRTEVVSWGPEQHDRCEVDWPARNLVRGSTAGRIEGGVGDRYGGR